VRGWLASSPPPSGLTTVFLLDPGVVYRVKVTWPADVFQPPTVEVAWCGDWASLDVFSEGREWRIGMGCAAFRDLITAAIKEV
jgi:hypothetical protein